MWGFFSPWLVNLHYSKRLTAYDRFFSQSTTCLGFCYKEVLKNLFQVHQEIPDSFWSWEHWSWEMLSASNAAEAFQLLLNLVIKEGAPHIRRFQISREMWPRCDHHFSPWSCYIDFIIVVLWIITWQDKWSFYRLLRNYPWKGFS